MTTFKKSLLALSIAAILSACDGDSSSNNNDDDDTASAFGTTVSGVAAKGIIIGGTVVARELNADTSVRNANVGSATTDDSGGYNLTLNNTYEGGSIQISITSNAMTLIVCDISGGCGSRTDDVTDNNNAASIDFGEQYRLGDGSLTMTALLPDAQDGETLSVQITPFTNMAAVQALSGGTVDSDAINKANSSVSNLLGGLDILALEPVDITNLNGNESADAVAYAALVASIAELAPTGANGQPNINAAIGNLASSFTGGSIAAEDNGNSDAVIALQEIITQAAIVLSRAGVTDNAGVLADLQNDVNEAVAEGGSGIVTPTPNDNIGDTDVALTRAFIADLRTLGVTINAEIEAPSQAFDAQLSLADEASDMIQDATFEAVAFGAMAIVEVFLGEIEGLENFRADDDSGVFFSAGSITQSATSSTLSDGRININGIDVSLTMTLESPADNVTSSTIRLAVVNVVAEDASARLEASNGSIDVTLAAPYTIDYDAIEAGTAAEPSAPISLEFDFDVVFTQLQTLSEGQVVTAIDPVSYTADISTTLFTYVVGGEAIAALPGSFSASGTVSNTTGDSFDIALSASIPSAATVAMNPAQPGLAEGSTYESNNGNPLISWTVSENQFVYNHPFRSFTATFDPLDSRVSLNRNGFLSPFFGSFESVDDFIVQNSFLLGGFLFEFYEEGQGDYERESEIVKTEDYTQNGSVIFRLDDPDVEFFNDATPLLATVGVQFTAQLDGLPEARVSLTGTTTAFEQGNADLTIAYGNTRLVFLASNDNAAPNRETASLEIINENNVRLLLNPLGLNGVESDDVNVTINGRVIATITETNGFTRVEYIDGTFESL